MKTSASYFLLTIIALQAADIYAQQTQKPSPTFTLSIAEDRNASATQPGLDRVLVKLTHIGPGVELEKFHPEALGMYNMIVLRDGRPAKETSALKALRNYRKADPYPTIDNPKALKPGESWITPIDISGYFDMTTPGSYQVTITRESIPMNPAYSTLVSSNTITIVAPSSSGDEPPNLSERPRPRFTLAIEPSDPDNWPGPPVVIDVDRENTSGQTIREAKCWTFMGMYNLVVTRDGEPIVENHQMKQLKRNRSAVDCNGNETLIEIAPGESDSEEIPVSNFFDVSIPGSYVVSVTRETDPWNPAKSILVESNTISFIVQPPESQAAGTKDQ